MTQTPSPAFIQVRLVCIDRASLLVLQDSRHLLTTHHSEDVNLGFPLRTASPPSHPLLIGAWPMSSVAKSYCPGL